MEVMGERAVVKVLHAADREPPRGRALYRWSMAGDLLSNTLYYSLVGIGFPQRAWLGGTLLGLGAGLGAVTLPRALGLGRQPSARSPLTQALTVAWYTLGGLATAGTFRALRTSTE
jgi:hypothetical protein